MPRPPPPEAGAEKDRPPPPRDGVKEDLPAVPGAGAVKVRAPPRDGAEKVLPVPEPDGVALLPALERKLDRIPGSGRIPGAAWARGALNMVRWLRGTPVEMKPLRLETPMPAKVRPLKRATGSTRKTRWLLMSL